MLARDSAFLVDTVMMEVVRRGISIHSVMNNVYWAERDGDGVLQRFRFDQQGAGQREALIHIEIDRQPDEALLGDITRPLQETLGNSRQRCRILRPCRRAPWPLWMN